MLTLSQCLGTCIDMAGIWVLFDRFRMVQGWTLPEVGLIYGIIHMGFSLAETCARGFDQLDVLVKQGDFDRILLRPLSPLLQVAVRDVQLMRLGRFFQGLAIAVWSVAHLPFPWISPHTAVIGLAILGSASLFYGLFVIQGALSFWTTETLELMNITTYGGVHAGQYPVTLYHRTFRLLCTFLIPIACVGYYPVAVLLRQETVPWILGSLAPLLGIGFLWLACCVWRLGVYRFSVRGGAA